MKFSAMTTKEQAKIICEIAPVVNRISQDAELNEKLSAMAKDKSGKTLLQMAMTMIDTFAPFLLDKHYDDTMIVCGSLLGKTASEMEEMGVLRIIFEIKGIVDEELIGFFKPSAGTETKP